MIDSINGKNYKSALCFKNLLIGKGPCNFLAISKIGSTKEFRGTLAQCWPKLAQLNNEKYNIFVLINESQGAGHKDKDITKINALFLDYDGDDWKSLKKEDLLEKFPRKPHCIINTSPGHYHIYWAAEYVPLVQFKEAQQRLAQLYGGDEKVCNPARVMRLPGTKNWKPEHNGHLAKIIYINKNKPPHKYSILKDKLLKNQENKLAKKESKPQKPFQPIEIDQATLKPSVAQVEEWLSCISPEKRDVWIKVGMALKWGYGNEGWTIFTAWSSQSEKFDFKEAKRQWKSFNNKRGNPVTLKTLEYLAKKSLADASSEKEASDMLQLSGIFASKNSEIVKFDVHQGKWLNYRKGSWNSFDNYVHKVVEDFLEENVDKKSPLGKMARRSSGISEILTLAKSKECLHVKSSDLDSNPYIIGVALPSEDTGCIDLTTGNMRKAIPSDLLMRKTFAIYEPSATCPKFKNFIQQIMSDDDEMIEFMQAMLGYTIFGHVKEQVLFFFLGSGANGKGVLTKVIYHVLGDYATPIASALLKTHAKNPNSPSPALQSLVAKRLVICSEFQKNARLDEEFVKNFTGDDPIIYRGLYNNQASFMPQGKIILSTNEFPRIDFKDDALWRRIVPVPFKRTFTGEERNNDLLEELKAEASGILNWLIAGAKIYHAQKKLKLPQTVTRYLSSLRKSTDTVGDWLKNCCQLDESASEKASFAYESYKAHARNNKTQPLSVKEFKAELEAKGYESKKRNSGNVFLGIKLKESL